MHLISRIFFKTLYIFSSKGGEGCMWSKLSPRWLLSAYHSFSKQCLSLCYLSLNVKIFMSTSYLDTLTIKCLDWPQWRKMVEYRWRLSFLFFSLKKKKQFFSLWWTHFANSLQDFNSWLNLTSLFHLRDSFLVSGMAGR